VKRLARATVVALTIAMPAAAGIVAFRRVSSERSAAAPTGHHLRSGTEIVAVLLAGSFCVSSRDPGLKRALAAVHQQLAIEGADYGFNVAVIGVALDWDPGVGRRFLEHLGSLDEIVAGRNWLSIGALDFVWREHVGPSDVPQLLIARHQVTIGPNRVSVGPDEVLKRMVGVAAIDQWVTSERSRATLRPVAQ
jgi:hypothetical protein